MNVSSLKFVVPHVGWWVRQHTIFQAGKIVGCTVIGLATTFLCDVVVEFTRLHSTSCNLAYINFFSLRLFVPHVTTVFGRCAKYEAGGIVCY